VHVGFGPIDAKTRADEHRRGFSAIRRFKLGFQPGKKFLKRVGLSSV
jgi:hypothetical protein